MAAPSPHRRRVSGPVLAVGIIALLAMLICGAACVYALLPRGGSGGRPRQGPLGADKGSAPAAKPAPIDAVLASAIVAAEPSHYAELDGVGPLSDAALERARREQPQRDWLAAFRTEMDRRYRLHDRREGDAGGFIDLDKVGLARRMHDDLVEWRFLRNRRRAALGGRPNEAAEWQRHPRAASPILCSADGGRRLVGPGDAPTQGAKSQWRPAFEAGHVPVSDDGSLVVSAREIVRQRVGVWDPPRDSEEFLSRPTVLCASLVTKPARLENAFMQYALWGRYCDDFAIFVPHLPADVTIGTDFDEGYSTENTKALANKYQFPVRGLHVVEVTNLPTVADLEAELRAAAHGPNAAAGAPQPNDANAADHMRAVRDEQIRRSRWPFFREVARTLDTWGRFGFFEHTFFVNEDVYAVPENLYAMLSDPAVAVLTGLGTPMYLGARMAVPGAARGVASVDGATVSELTSGADAYHTKADSTGKLTDSSNVPHAGAAPYINGDAFVISHSAMRLVTARLHSPECYPHETTAAADIALSRCLAAVGVFPRDTADSLGHDRFPVLSLNWLARIAVDPAASPWLPRFRPRPMPRGFAVVSERAVAFPLVKTLEDMAAVHAWIFESDGSRAYASG